MPKSILGSIINTVTTETINTAEDASDAVTSIIDKLTGG